MMFARGESPGIGEGGNRFVVGPVSWNYVWKRFLKGVVVAEDCHPDSHRVTDVPTREQ